MTAFAADAAGSSTPAILTARTGAGGTDTIPGGSYVVWRNTGAGSHTVTLSNAGTSDGLTIAARTWTMAAGEVRGGRVNPNWADSTNQVTVTIGTGTLTEVVYYVIGGV